MKDNVTFKGLDPLYQKSRILRTEWIHFGFEKEANLKMG
jgi:hypothetical protein